MANLLEILSDSTAGWSRRPPGIIWASRSHACPTDPAMRWFPQPVLPLKFLQKSQWCGSMEFNVTKFP